MNGPHSVYICPPNPTADSSSNHLQKMWQQLTKEAKSANYSQKLWEAVRQFTGRKRNVGTDISGITAGSLNQHYADISTDAEFSEPIVKYSACCSEDQYISEWEVFKHLDTLRHTETGLDMLPCSLVFETWRCSVL